ncbi:sensor histidine kinase, partial [Spirochaetota bacterium]
PCGLVINEILSNAFKHAFKDIDKPEINVDFNKIDDNNVSLTIKDNGKGLDKGFGISESNGLGLKLVDILTEQLDGKLEISGDNGAKFMLTFPEKIKQARYLPNG